MTTSDQIFNIPSNTYGEARQHNHPERVRTSENCAVMCASCHAELANDDGRLQAKMLGFGDDIFDEIEMSNHV